MGQPQRHYVEIRSNLSRASCVCDIVTSTPARPQRPCLGPGDTNLRLLLWSGSLSRLASLFSRCFCFPSIVVFSEEPCPLRMAVRLQLCHFCLRQCFGLICSRTYLFIALATRGIHKALLQHRITNESFFFFLSAFFIVKLLHLYGVIGNTRAGMILAMTHLCS